jgi:hypothetical protein
VPPEPLPWWRIAAPLIAFISLCLICGLRPLPLLRIVLLCGLGMIGYGALQDQISARLSPEYFTIGHAPVPGISHPTLVGIAWGFLGGFPGGIALGIPLALAATLGDLPRLTARTLARPLLIVLAVTAIGTLIAGASGAYNASVVNIAIGEPWASFVPHERQWHFFVVACAHFGTYLGAGIAGCGLCLWAIWRRLGLVHGMSGRVEI